MTTRHITIADKFLELSKDDDLKYNLPAFAHAACVEVNNDWKEGSTTWFFSDCSCLKIGSDCDTESFYR